MFKMETFSCSFVIVHQFFQVLVPYRSLVDLLNHLAALLLMDCKWVDCWSLSVQLDSLDLADIDWMYMGQMLHWEIVVEKD